MVNLTLLELDPQVSEVKKLLDEPAQKFLKTDTIVALYTRAYNVFNHKITIDVDNQVVVLDAIYAVTAWHAFGAYGNSIRRYLELRDIGPYEINLEHYKEIAVSAAALVGVDITLDGATDSVPLSDALPYINSGRSMLDVDR